MNIMVQPTAGIDKQEIEKNRNVRNTICNES